MSTPVAQTYTTQLIFSLLTRQLLL